MKNDLKISTLSIVCVLCAAFAAPAFGAASVRSLGGVGTYAGASNAAAAKSNPTTASTANAVRGGSMRVNNTASGVASNRVGSSRAATTPRLSIGKYLAGSSAVSGGSSNRVDKIEGGLSSTTQATEELSQQVQELKVFVDYDANADSTIADKVSSLELDVEKLAADLTVVSGAHTTVEYANGVLTVVQNGETKSFDLSADYAGKSEFEALQAAVDSITGGYATKEDLKSVSDAVAALQTADAAMDTAIKALQGGSVDKDSFANQVAELQGVDTALQSAIAELKNTMPSVEGLVNKTYVDGLVAELESADMNLQSALDEYKVSNDASIAKIVQDLNAVIADLKGADELLAKNIVELQSGLAAAATKDELAAAKAELEKMMADIEAGNLTSLQNYYTKAEADAKFATKDELGQVEGALTQYAKTQEVNQALASYATTEQLQANYLSKTDAEQKYLTQENVNNFVEIKDGSITAVKLAQGAVTSDKINTQLGAGEMVMLMSNGDGTSSWVSVTVDAE